MYGDKEVDHKEGLGVFGMFGLGGAGGCGITQSSWDDPLPSSLLCARKLYVCTRVSFLQQAVVISTLYR